MERPTSSTCVPIWYQNAPLSFLPSFLPSLRFPFFFSARRAPLSARTSSIRPPKSPKLSGGKSLRTAADGSIQRCFTLQEKACPCVSAYIAAEGKTGGYLYFANRPLSCETIVAWSLQSGMALTRWFPSWGAGPAGGPGRGEVKSRK